MGQFAKLIDISKCVGCRACEVACKEWNETGTDSPADHPFGYQSHTDLTYRTWNVVKFFEQPAGHAHQDHDNQSSQQADFDARYQSLLGPEPTAEPTAEPEVELNYSVWNVTKFFQQQSALDARERATLSPWMFRKHGCMHCRDAACVKACPVDALARNDQLGYVHLDVAACTGCGYCVDACPFDVPQLAAGAVLGFGKVSKCRLCSDRIQHGMQPACVQACPPNALEFGLREDMIELGHSRIADLQTRGYSDAQLYGEHELGGLNVLTVLPGKPEEFALPVQPEVPKYLTTWKEVVQPLGAVAIAGTALALGFGFLNSVLRGSTKKAGDGHGKG